MASKKGNCMPRDSCASGRSFGGHLLPRRPFSFASFLLCSLKSTQRVSGALGRDTRAPLQHNGVSTRLAQRTLVAIVVAAAARISLAAAASPKVLGSLDKFGQLCAASSIIISLLDSSGQWAACRLSAEQQRRRSNLVPLTLIGPARQFAARPPHSTMGALGGRKQTTIVVCAWESDFRAS